MCKRTCREQYPDEPNTWCDDCVEAEAADRLENLRRWQQWHRMIERELETIVAEQLAIAALCYQETTL